MVAYVSADTDIHDTRLDELSLEFADEYVKMADRAAQREHLLQGSPLTT